MADTLYKANGSILDVGGGTSPQILEAPTNIPEAEWVLGEGIDTEGVYYPVSPTWALTDYIPFDNYLGFYILDIKDANGVDMHTRIATYDEGKNLLNVYADTTVKLSRFDTDVAFFRVCFGRSLTTGINITSADIATYFSIVAVSTKVLKYTLFNKDMPKTWGQRNVIERAKQMTDIVYTATNNLPKLRGTTYPAGTQIKGLPYSNVSEVDKFIGQNVSLHTFMTAIHNPKSILYTQTIPQPSGAAEAKLYYGTVCSSFTAYALDQPHVVRCRDIITNATDYDVIPIQAMELCDLIMTDTHAIMVTGIWRDEYQRITHIEVSESVQQNCYRHTLTWAQALSTYADATICRYQNINTAAYTPSKYVPLMDEQPQTITYSDICTNMGDKAVIKAGEDININPLKTNGYTAIHLFKNGTQIDTYAVEDVELSDLEAGEYTAKLYPYNDNAITTFTVASATVALNGNRLSFSGFTACVPQYIAYCDPVNQSSDKVTVLTSTDISRGYIDLDAYSANLALVKLYVGNENGNVAYGVTRTE